MKIDNDLMDGDMLRVTNESENNMVYNAYNDNIIDDIEDFNDPFLLGRQYERNQQKDDGK